MRISDWSSDVCSSDLLPADRRHCARSPDRRPHRRRASPPLRFPRPPSPRPSAPVARTSKTVPPCSRRARRAALLPFQGASFLLPSEVCADAEFPRPRIGFGLEQAITARPALISPIRRVVAVHELREELHLPDDAVFHRGVELEVRLDVAILLSVEIGRAHV